MRLFIYFLRFEDLLAVGKSNARALANRVIIFALKRQNVGQKRFARPSGSPPYCLPMITPNSAMRLWQLASMQRGDPLDRLFKQRIAVSRRSNSAPQSQCPRQERVRN